MSVSLLEVLEGAGYDVLHNREDAEWLLSQEDEFEELYDKAEEVVEREEEEEEEEETR